MKFLKIVGIITIFLVVMGIAALNVVLSIKNDMASMQDENPAIFLINPENGEIDLGFGIDRDEGGVMLIDAEQKVNDVPLRALFKNSEESGAGEIVGGVLRGYIYSNGKIEDKSIQVDRVVLIDDTVVAEIFSIAGPQKIEIGGKDDLFYAQSVVDTGELLSVLRGDFEKLEWEVTIANPLLGKPVVKKATTEELLSMAENFGINIDKDLIKVLILVQVAEKAKLALQSEEAKMEIFRITLKEYKNGKIRTYPENTLTKMIKLLPEEQILRQLEGRM
jgi:hypothetical protein